MTIEEFFLECIQEYFQILRALKKNFGTAIGHHNNFFKGSFKIIFELCVQEKFSK